MKRFKELVRETAVEPDMPSSAAMTYKEKPNKEPMAKLKEQNDTTEKVEMVQSQLHFIKYACEEILEYIEQGGKVEEWYQVKVAKSFSEFESLHAFIEGESRRTGMKEETELDEGILSHFAKKIVNSAANTQTPTEIANTTIRAFNKKAPGTKMHNHPNFSKFKSEVHAHVSSAKTGEEALRRSNDDHVKSLAKKHFNEEVEQIDELSNELLGRYKDKAVVSHGEAEKAKNYKLSDKRFSGVVKATNKQFANFRKKPFKLGEETEQLDELSKSTLGSYVKKASFSLGQKGIEVGQSNDKKKWAPITKKMNKRTDSIIKATDRLTKEETEQLDEISAETKTSYTQKATKEIEQLKPHAEKGEYKDIAQNIIKKREKGIAMAKEEKEVPFEGGTTMPKQKVIPGKHGSGYSTARHLARQALKKQAEKMKPVKESLEESRKAEIVKEIVKKKKNEKNDTESFQKDPILSSEITKA